MGERIVINGQPVDVPADVVAEGRAAVAHWHAAQLAEAGLPYVTVDGAAVELPPERAEFSDEDNVQWIRDLRKPKAPVVQKVPGGGSVELPAP